MNTPKSFTAEILEQNLNMSQLVVDRLLNDLDASQWLMRPHVNCNPINWQVGHLILSEHQQVSKITVASMPQLPEDFEEIYQKPSGRPTELPCCESTDMLLGKGTLHEAMQLQRAATIRVLHQFSPEQLQVDSGIKYAPKIYSVFLMIAIHWTMHSGQWAVVRREAGLPIAM